MAWYENPTVAAVLGAVAGAVMSAAVALFVWRKTHKIRRVDCVISNALSLLAFSDTIKDKLEVTYAGEKAESIYLFSVEVLNSGTQAVQRQPIQIRLDACSNVVGYTLRTEPEVGFGEIKEVARDGNALDLEVSLMNPGDRVFIELISTDTTSERIDVYMKNANVVARVYDRRTAENALKIGSVDAKMLGLAALGSLPFFGGMARSLMTIELGSRIDKISKKTKA